MKSRITNIGTFEGRVVSKESKPKFEPLDSASAEFSPDELKDFLAADYLEARADNKFKEDLRKKLWQMVDERYGRKTPRAK